MMTRLSIAAITVVRVDAGPHPNNAAQLHISIQYEVKATHDRRSLVHPFYLIPEE